MRKTVHAAVLFLLVLPAGWLASQATATSFPDGVAATSPAQPSMPLLRLAQASLGGTYEGNVNRRYVASGQGIATRLYRIAVNPDLVNGTVWIYENGKLLHVLLIKGNMQGGRVFVGTTRPVEGVANYTPDNIRLEFSADGRSVAWYHHDGTLEGSGTLVRR